MSAVLTDPNYSPQLVYPDLERLLFYYRPVYLYAPSGGQIDWVSRWYPGNTSPDRVAQLIEAGLVIPVAPSFWWNRKEREKIVQQDPNNEEHRRTYTWTPLDDRILALGPAKQTKNRQGWESGYQICEEHRSYALRVKEDIPKDQPVLFEAYARSIANLRKRKDALPQELLLGKYKNATAESVAAQTIRYAAGDIRLGDILGVSSVFAPPQVTQIYQSVVHIFAPRDLAFPGKTFTVVDPNKEYHLSGDEIDIAFRFADQLLSRGQRFDIGLLVEYHETNCATLFREFVNAHLQKVGSGGLQARDAVHLLESAFDSRLSFLPSLRQTIDISGAVTVTTLTQFLLDERLKKQRIKRRKFLKAFAKIGVAVPLSLFSAKIIDTTLAEPLANVVANRFDRMIALIAAGTTLRKK